MAGVFDTIAGALSGKATGDGHTTSGLDRAMQAHADSVHPVGAGAGVQQGPAGSPKITRCADGSIRYPLDGPCK
jgi:hypothetical protein